LGIIAARLVTNLAHWHHKQWPANKIKTTFYLLFHISILLNYIVWFTGWCKKKAERFWSFKIDLENYHFDPLWPPISFYLYLMIHDILCPPKLGNSFRLCHIAFHNHENMSLKDIILKILKIVYSKNTKRWKYCPLSEERWQLTTLSNTSELLKLGGTFFFTFLD